MFQSMTMCLLSLVAVFLTAGARAGEFNPVLSIGDSAPVWSDLPGTDGKRHSLADLADRELVVLVFTCNSCPSATDYEDRIITLAKKFAAHGVEFVAVNVNKVPEDSFEEMTKRAEAKKFPFVYLFDETQQIAKDYGATFTPEFFVLDKSRKIAYMGGMDDSSYESMVTKRFLEPAIEAVLAGGKVDPTETTAIGCQIRYERTRRRPTK